MTFRGALTEEVPEDVAGVTLYYRWYSSLFSGNETDIEQERFAMNVVEGVILTDPATEYSHALGVGTHAISFAATDQQDETTAAQETVLHGGVTGGAEGDGQCLIHVFKANLLSPRNNVPLSRANATLVAEAPTLWGVKIGNTGIYEPNADYHKINRLQYRWHFTPDGAPSGRREVDFVPALEALAFREPDDDFPFTHLRYEGPLPGELTGRYNLTLHVEGLAVEGKEDIPGEHTMTVTNIQVGP